jgi:hypothetical protein
MERWHPAPPCCGGGGGAIDSSSWCGYHRFCCFHFFDRRSVSCIKDSRCTFVFAIVLVVVVIIFLAPVATGSRRSSSTSKRASK